MFQPLSCLCRCRTFVTGPGAAAVRTTCSVDYFCGLTDSLLDEARRRALHNPHGDARRETALLTVRAYDRGLSYPCVEEDDPEGVMAARVTVGVQWRGAAVLAAAIVRVTLVPPTRPCLLPPLLNAYLNVYCQAAQLFVREPPNLDSRVKHAMFSAVRTCVNVTNT